MILSTLAELEESEEEVKRKQQEEEKIVVEEEIVKEPPKPLMREKESHLPEEETQKPEAEKVEVKKSEPEKQEVQEDIQEEEDSFRNIDDERQFCQSMRERILVLFEGFQSPNNKSIEAKVDLTLNFLEYLLAVIDERLEILDKKHT